MTTIKLAGAIALAATLTACGSPVREPVREPTAFDQTSYEHRRQCQADLKALRVKVDTWSRRARIAEAVVMSGANLATNSRNLEILEKDRAEFEAAEADYARRCG